MSTEVYQVEGMTCAHCAAAVTREVQSIDGVEDVAVDVDRGTVAIVADVHDDDVIAAAVDEAGYRLVGRR
ncbi:heavy-metal-associated domain-containing protein [Microbacterium sp. P01]|uniref:heavy-metal-associated domain-containing protein n=1 Tax=unclassified Microbacterium TaxID=2609290 RepID=UPI003672A4E0